MREVLSQLEALWQRPGASSFAQLGAADALNFSSHAWTVSLDPATGALPSACPYGQQLQLKNPHFYRALNLLSLTVLRWAWRSVVLP